MARIFITGSAGGLGLAAAESLLGDGHEVIVQAGAGDGSVIPDAFARRPSTNAASDAPSSTRRRRPGSAVAACTYARRAST